jgi:hypothetical protein
MIGGSLQVFGEATIFRGSGVYASKSSNGSDPPKLTSGWLPQCAPTTKSGKRLIRREIPGEERNTARRFLSPDLVEKLVDNNRFFKPINRFGRWSFFVHSDSDFFCRKLRSTSNHAPAERIEMPGRRDH